MRNAAIFFLILLLVIGGCLDSRQQQSPVPIPATIETTRVVTAIPTEIPVTKSPEPTLVPATLVTTTPRPTPATISEEALNARLVDARNKLTNLIDSDVADTVIIHPGGQQGCEIKKFRELGYLIDATTGESVFIKGDY